MIKRILLFVLALMMVGGVASAAEPTRGVVVLLDTSGSMAPDRIVLARKAITDYVAGLQPDVLVGFVAFSDKPQLLVPPTADRGQVTAAVNSVQAKGNTSLHDAVPLAVSALNGITERRLVIVSDGEDTVSKTSLDAAVQSLVDNKIPADVVGFQYQDAALQRIADAAGGRLLTANDAPQLAAAFAALVVPTTAPAVSAPTTTVAPPPAVVEPSSTSWQTALVIGGTFLVLLLVALLLFGSGGRGGPGEKLDQQIGQYGPGRRTGHEPVAAQEGSVARTALDVTGRLIGERRASDIATKLDLAGMRFKPTEWTLLRVCLAIALAAGLAVLTGVPWLGIPLGLLLGWLGTAAYVSAKTTRRRAAFGEQLPDVLQLIAGSLRSGFSLSQSIDGVVRDGAQPAAGEFSRALAATRIGAELEDALDQVAHRMESRDLAWVVMAIRIQRQVGGNLAEVLLNTVGTMRDRAKTRRQIRALSAEGRLSAYVLIALPLCLGTWLFLARPDYMRPLHTTLPGWLMLGGAALLVVLGAFWMRKLVKVEV
ncbi:hypothetical protein Lesp02_80120 [Lentzea sp. NBRC 105346]|uniref:VWA domain-containing protein n=1 Tax=Lentzea sp. NBRC 105346 TaxID=3032205 RepID=UPI0024A09C78|nr:VWA domain-containing protein [Lentzea sp. NBRC 105346]GLZ35825.1 hypothetical protein Lesp02_80120 [Lentzea sp. NBRC 105346]